MNISEVSEIHVTGRRWFDHVNGNTYSSARVYSQDDLITLVEFQYGYGDFYLQAAAEKLDSLGFFEGALGDLRYHDDTIRSLQQICKQFGIRFTCNVKTTSKKETVNWGKTLV